MLNKPLLSLPAATLLSLLMTACSPEVGSDRWCQNMDNKAKGDWTANEAADYTKHCLFKTDDS